MPDRMLPPTWDEAEATVPGEAAAPTVVGTPPNERPPVRPRTLAHAAAATPAAPVAAATRPLPGATSFPQDPEIYQLEQQLAVGGMGRVLAARGEKIGRAVALKQVLVADDRMVKRFEREALITARLQHPGIVPVYGVGRTADGKPFYAMKLVEGGALDRAIERAASLSERMALLPNVIAVVEALAYAHGHRVIHRDLKPANVLVGPFGETVVVDWGLAKNLADRDDPLAPEEAPGAAEATRLGQVMGTPAYMPLEQARGEPVDERSDVYALGAILYHVLAGRPPYLRAGETSASWNAVRARVLTGPPEPLAQLAPEVPRDLLAIVDRAMAPYPHLRYPSAAELAGDLRRFQTGQLVGVYRYSTRELLLRWLGRHRAAVAVAAVALGALVVTGALAVTRVVRARNVAEARRLVAEGEAAIESDPARAAAALDDAMTLEPMPRAELLARRWGQRRLRWLLPADADAVSCGPGGRLATGGSGEVVLWQVGEDGEPAPVRRLAIDGAVSAVALSPRGDTVAVGQDGGAVSLWSIADGRMAWRAADAHTDDVDRIVWLADGSRFLTASDDGQLRAFVAAGGARSEPLGALPRRSSALAIAASADPTSATEVAVAGDKLWLFELDQTPPEPAELPSGANDVALLDDGVVLAVGLHSRLAVRSGARALAEPDDAPRINHLAVAHGLLAEMRSGDVVTLTDLATGAPASVTRALALPGPGLGLTWCPDRPVLGVLLRDRSILLYDLSTRPAVVTEVAGGVTELLLAMRAAVSPDGRRVALSAGGGAVQIAPLAGGPPIRCAVADKMPGTLAWSRDGRLLAGDEEGGRVAVWRVDDAGCTPLGISPALGGDRKVTAIAWRADGGELVAGLSAPDKEAGGVARLRVDDLAHPVWIGDGRFGTLTTVAWSDNGVLAGFAPSGSFATWRAGHEADARWTPTPPSMRGVTGLYARFRPHSDDVAFATFDGSVTLFDADLGQVRWRQQWRGAPPADIAWSADGGALAVARLEDMRVLVRDAATGEATAEHETPFAILSSIGWSAGGGIVIGGARYDGRGVAELAHAPLADVRAGLRAHLAAQRRVRDALAALR